MLNINASTLMETRPGTLASGITTMDEGTALVYVLENGVGKVKPAAGGANEVFAGVALGNPIMSTQTNRVETFTVPGTAPYQIKLARTPVGDPLVVVEANSSGGTKVTLAKNASASATQYAISGNVVTLDSSFAGRTVRAQYAHALTVQELIQGPYGFDSNRVTDLGSVPAVGIISVGEVFVDNFDPLADWETWSGSNPVKLAANGKFTLGGSGATVDAAVIAVPSVASGFLGLKIQSY